jgi:hypothetical protein
MRLALNRRWRLRLRALNALDPKESSLTKSQQHFPDDPQDRRGYIAIDRGSLELSCALVAIQFNKSPLLIRIPVA